MKKHLFNSKLLKTIIGVSLFFVILNTHVVTNCLNILTDSTNYIPDHSSVFTFQPTQIDSGSGGYWRYGKDYSHYYYFSEKEANTYFFVSKDKECDGFEEFNHLTWCEPIKVKHQQ